MIKQFREVPADESVKVGYSFGGKMIDSDEFDSLAMSVHKNTITKYYVKYCIFGADAGHMANPISINHTNFTTKDRFNRQQYKYKQVSKETFQHYLKFLETRNQAWLRQAERMATPK